MRLLGLRLVHKRFLKVADRLPLRQYPAWYLSAAVNVHDCMMNLLWFGHSSRFEAPKQFGKAHRPSVGLPTKKPKLFRQLLIEGHVYTAVEVFGFKKYCNSHKKYIRIRWPFTQKKYQRCILVC